MRWPLVSLLLLGAACDGGEATSPDAPFQPLPDAVPLTCDTIVQDCASHGSVATPKCSVVVAPNGDLVTRCVGLNGTLGLNATCMRLSGGPGFDDCDKGLYCSGLVEPQTADGTPTMRQCRKFCRDDTPCATGEHCVALGSNTPQDGLCIPTGCDLFSTTCGDGNTCDVSKRVDVTMWIGMCRTAGATAVGGDCTNSLCVANGICVGDPGGATGTCRADCDATHPCAGSTACKVLAGLANSAGYCPQ